MNLLKEYISILLEDKWEEYADTAKEIDRSLPDEAERAISSFVASDIDKKIYYGLMDATWLEDAYSENPSEKGVLIRRQLEKAIAPLRNKLSEVYGRFVPLYRAQGPRSPDSSRNTLSMSQNKEFVRYWFSGSKHGPRKQYWAEIRTPIIPGYDTGDIIKTLYDYSKEDLEKRISKLMQSKWIQNQVQEFNDFLKDHYPNNPLVTVEDLYLETGEDTREYKKFERLKQGKSGEIPGGVVHYLVPINDIVWVTNRAGQKEFIVKNKPYTKIPFDSERVPH